MSKETLLPCPWAVPGEDHTLMVLERTCDRDDKYNPHDHAFPLVVCMCGAQVAGKDWTGPETAVAAWNRRAVAPSPVVMPEEVDEALQEIDGLRSRVVTGSTIPLMSWAETLASEVRRLRAELVAMREALAHARTLLRNNGVIGPELDPINAALTGQAKKGEA